MNRPLGGRLHDESGIALLLVLGISLFLTLFVTALLALTSGSLRLARDDADWHAALAAAEAGVDDLLFRMNTSPSNQPYWERVTPGAPKFDNGNKALTMWVPVSSSGAGRFRYTVENRVPQDGSVVVRSSGAVGETVRTVEVVLRQRRFLDFMYLTDKDSMDPRFYASWPPPEIVRKLTETEKEGVKQECRDLLGAIPACDAYPIAGSAARALTQQFCSGYMWPDPSRKSERQGRHEYCIVVRWTSGANLYGRFHSNDAVAMVTSPHYYENMTSTWQDPDKYYWWNLHDYPKYKYWFETTPVRATPTFETDPDADGDGKKRHAKYAEKLAMPPLDSKLRDRAATSTSDSCLFTGPTRMVFNGATAEVYSPLTASPSPLCPLGSDGTGTISLASVRLIYVDNATTACPVGQAHPLPYATGDHPESASLPAAYSQCTPDGDLFVEGSAQATVTLAAERDIVVTNHFEYADDTRDLVGLIAKRNVDIFHPVRCTVRDNDVCIKGEDVWYLPGPARWTNPTIDAAILSIDGSFRLQNHYLGSGLGALYVYGTMAQNYRGLLGTPPGTHNGSAGLGKHYTYDDRFALISPPYFLSPDAESWAGLTFAELKPVYAAP